MKTKLNTHNYSQVLEALELNKFWEDQLLGSKSEVNIEALRKIDDLGGSFSSSVIMRKTSSSDSELRKQAKSLFLKSSSYNTFKYLEDDFDNSFNQLDEIRIHSALSVNSKLRPLPLLIRWVNTAKNNKYKAFLIKEMGFFKQTEGADFLMKLFRDEVLEYTVKAQVAETLGVLGHKEAIPLFIGDFHNNHELVQLNIIGALGKLGGKEALDFLEMMYHEVHNHETVVKILENIYKIDSSGETFKRLKLNVVNEFREKAIAYVESGTSAHDNLQPKLDGNAEVSEAS